MRITYLKKPTVLENENTDCSNFNGHCCAAGRCCNKPAEATNAGLKSIAGAEEEKLLVGDDTNAGLKYLIENLTEDKIKMLKESGILDTGTNNITLIV